MRIYNSLTQTKEEFTPLHRPVRIYVCGITPYDTTHIGHAFTYVMFDVLVRYLENKGYPVRYVQNVTDVDDDILRRAKKIGVTWDRLAQEQTALYLKDMKALNVRAPDVMPSASEEIPTIIDIADCLLSQGFAYISGNNVYYEVAKDPAYGRLSRFSREHMLALAKERGGYPEDSRKKDPLDFVLWQESTPDEPSWDSPWSKGRPGWHIECSAMSLKYLGETLDIHGGGADLIFPHHESEIVQSERYTRQQPLSRFWIHTGMVRLDGEKMSKSLGNLVMVRDVLNQYSGDVIRLHLLSFHYRQSWEYSGDGLEKAQSLTLEIKNALDGWTDNSSTPEPDPQFRNAFIAALEDDLDTPKAIKVMRDAAGEIASRRKIGDQSCEIQSALAEMARVLGLSFS